jgi:hypothetical protein
MRVIVAGSRDITDPRIAESAINFAAYYGIPPEQVGWSTGESR